MLLEHHARALLLLHGLVAAVLVGASTHQLLWCRHYLRGRFDRARAERRFAAVASAAFVATFFLGNLLYPTYKVRVRAEYFDAPSAVVAEGALRDSEAAHHHAPLPRAEAADLSWVGRLFDVKEHWVALGCAASLALLLLSRRAHPEGDRRLLALYLGLSFVVAGTAWTGAVIGLVTASFRAVGGVS